MESRNKKHISILKDKDFYLYTKKKGNVDWYGNPIQKCCGEFPEIIKHKNRGDRGRTWWEIHCKKCENRDVGDGKKQTIGCWNSLVKETKGEKEGK